MYLYLFIDVNNYLISIWNLYVQTDIDNHLTEVKKQSYHSTFDVCTRAC